MVRVERPARILVRRPEAVVVGVEPQQRQFQQLREERRAHPRLVARLRQLRAQAVEAGVEALRVLPVQLAAAVDRQALLEVAALLRLALLLQPVAAVEVAAALRIRSNSSARSSIQARRWPAIIACTRSSPKPMSRRRERFSIRTRSRCKCAITPTS